MVKISPSNARGTGSIPGWGAKIPYTLWPKNQNMKQKQYCNKFNNDFKNGPHLKKKKNTLKAKRACPPFFLFAARTKYRGQCRIVLLFYGLPKCLPWKTTAAWETGYIRITSITSITWELAEMTKSGAPLQTDSLSMARPKGDITGLEAVLWKPVL